MRLAVWHKRPASGPPLGVLVLVHGVWAMDHEGYGRFTVTCRNSDIRCGVEDLKALMPLITEQTGRPPRV